MRALLAGVFVVFAATLAGGVESGQACSCALPDPRAALAQADGAFVGTLVSRREGDQTTVLTFSVEKALKGAIGRTVEVSTASNSAACGIEVRTGTRVGLVVERRGGTWSGYLCWQFDPDELLAAAKPLPAPNGRGPSLWWWVASSVMCDSSRSTLEDGRSRTGEAAVARTSSPSVQRRNAWPSSPTRRRERSSSFATRTHFASCVVTG